MDRGISQDEASRQDMLGIVQKCFKTGVLTRSRARQTFGPWESEWCPLQERNCECTAERMWLVTEQLSGVAQRPGQQQMRREFAGRQDAAPLQKYTVASQACCQVSLMSLLRNSFRHWESVTSFIPALSRGCVSVSEFLIRGLSSSAFSKVPDLKRQGGERSLAMACL